MFVEAFEWEMPGNVISSFNRAIYSYVERDKTTNLFAVEPEIKRLLKGKVLRWQKKIRANAKHRQKPSSH